MATTRTSKSTATRPARTTTETARRVRRDLEATLHRRSTQPHSRARRLEDATKRTGTRLWRLAKRFPYTGVAAATAAGVALAASIGVGELAIGVIVGYGAFKVLKQGESPGRAAGELAQEIGRV